MAIDIGHPHELTDNGTYRLKHHSVKIDRGPGNGCVYLCRGKALDANGEELTEIPDWIPEYLKTMSPDFREKIGFASPQATLKLQRGK